MCLYKMLNPPSPLLIGSVASLRAAPQGSEHRPSLLSLRLGSDLLPALKGEAFSCKPALHKIPLCPRIELFAGCAAILYV